MARGLTFWGEVKLLNCTSASMEDTPANVEVYAHANWQKPGCGFPLLDSAGIFSLSSGAWLSYAALPENRHALTLSVDLVRLHKAPVTGFGPRQWWGECLSPVAPGWECLSPVVGVGCSVVEGVSVP